MAAMVGTEGKYHGKSINFSDHRSSIVEDKFYVHESLPEKIDTALDDHEQLIETFEQLRQLFPLHMKVQRRRKRDPEIHVSNSSLSRIAHIENREHVRVGPEDDMSMEVVGRRMRQRHHRMLGVLWDGMLGVLWDKMLCVVAGSDRTLVATHHHRYDDDDDNPNTNDNNNNEDRL